MVGSVNRCNLHNEGYLISGSLITRVCEKKNQRAKRSQMIKMVRMHCLLISM